MSERKTVRVTLYDGESGCSDWPTPGYGTPLTDVIDWFTDTLESVPEGFRDRVKCEISSASDYGDHVGSISIWYDRPETDDEMMERIRLERDAAARRREAELATLRALRQKYGDV